MASFQDSRISKHYSLKTHSMQLLSCMPTFLFLIHFQGSGVVAAFVKSQPTLEEAKPATLLMLSGQENGSQCHKEEITMQEPVEWVEKQISRGKTIMLAIAFMWFTKLVHHDVNKLTVAAEFVRLVGLGCLVHKIGQEETCAGLSFKSQMITATFLFVRLYCSSVMQQDVHVFMDFMTLVVTLWVLCKMQFKLRSTYSKDLDHFPLTYLLAPCAILSIFLHPSTAYPIIHRVLWAFSIYLEAVHILPQLNLMQSIRVIEPHTAHSVFALGVSRLLNCTHFVIRMVEGNKQLFKLIGPGLWPGMTLFAQIVSIFMLGDFSYYYIKSLIDGQRMVRLPVYYLYKNMSTLPTLDE